MSIGEWKVTKVRGGETLGKRLLEARASRGMTSAVIAREYAIPLSFLEALERGDYGRVPAKVYTRAFLKKYLTLLGLSVAEHLLMFEEEFAHFQKLSLGARPYRMVGTKPTLGRFEFTPSFFQKISAVAVGLIFLIYIGVRVDASIAPVSLALTSPGENLTTSERTLVILGETEREATITINGQAIPIDNEGRFEKSVLLEEGLNTLEVVAGKKYRPATTVTRHVLVTAAEL